MNITVKVTGQQAVISGLQNAVGQLKEKINDAIQEAGLSCEDDARLACPVDTGTLEASILYEEGYMECTVGTDVYYAPFVELGHRTRGGGSFVAPQPFLYPAFLDAAANLKSDLEDLL